MSKWAKKLIAFARWIDGAPKPKLQLFAHRSMWAGEMDRYKYTGPMGRPLQMRKRYRDTCVHGLPFGGGCLECMYPMYEVKAQ